MGRLRAAGLGLATILGLRTAGYVIPYRHAAADWRSGYPALKPLFVAAEPAMRDLLAQADALAADLTAIDGRGEAAARFDQEWFPTLDALAAYAMVRTSRPGRIVEIGSGHSTRFLARAVRDGALATAITCIDPQPRATIATLPVTHVPALLAEAPAAVFDGLRAGDMLFIDSSHIAMPGTDVDRLVLDVVPRLPAGTLLHVHDIFLPDDYPQDWHWRGYNEQLVIGALLAGGGWDILFASHWLATRHGALLSAGIAGRLPRAPAALPSSLWLRKR
jgi:predicted O-methyltransferase YrrM